jgi:DNA-3-methyladenine glycosylase
MNKALPQSFYTDHDVSELAPKLLGCYIHTNIDNVQTSSIIVETEAYRGADDKGCHAYRHGFTPKTRSMFKQGGHAYVYICYGMHRMFNIVAGNEGQGDAVLIRAVEPILGFDTMLSRRNMTVLHPTVTNGPGKVAAAMGIDMAMDGISITDMDSPIWVEKGENELHYDIVTSPRIGMSKYVAECSHWHWRFYIKGNKWVSKPLSVNYPEW